jgi:hypothetical protein
MILFFVVPICRSQTNHDGVRSLTLGVRHVLDHVAIFDSLDNTAYESLRTLRSVVDRDERVGTFGFGGGHLEFSSFFPWGFWWILL